MTSDEGGLPAMVDPTDNEIYWDKPCGHGDYLGRDVSDDPGSGPEKAC